jgi:ribokinase
VISGANATLSKEDIDSHLELLKESDIVILQLEIPLDTVLYAAKTAKSFGKTVILDPAPVPKVFPEELYQYIDVIKPNETELSMLTGSGISDDEIKQAVSRIRARGVREVLVTLGDRGVYVDSDSCGICMIPGYQVPVVDTTAAGDTFTAALALGIAEGKSIMESAEFANLVSAIVVTRKGAQSSIPTLEEVQRYQERMKSGH